MASITTVPPPSRRLGNRRTSLEAILVITSLREMGPKRSIRSSRFESLISFRRRGSSGPPPAMVNLESGCLSAKTLNAFTARPKPLIRINDPTEKTLNSSLFLFPEADTDKSSVVTPLTGNRWTLWDHFFGMALTESRLQTMIA